MSRHFGDIAATQFLPGRQSYFVGVPRAPDACGLSAISHRIVGRMGEPWGGGLERTTLESLSRKVYPEVNLTSPFSREGPDVVAATESARPPVARPKFQVH